MFDDGTLNFYIYTHTQLHERLEVRLQYAQFKLAHDRIAHTLDELENLYLRPFRTQARKRARERRDDPDRREWLQAAATVDDARPGEKEAHGARAGALVFDGEQPALLQVEPEVAEERGRHVRKRRQAAAAAALDWASPPPPAKAKRPVSRRLVRPDSLPQVPTRLDMSARADTAAPTLPAAAAPSSPSLKPLERDAQNRLAQYSRPARTARVYSVPSAREEKGTDGATTSGSREPFLGLTTSEGTLFSPVELHGAARAGPSPQAFDPASPPSNRRLSRRRPSAISPFSSRSTLESTGETLAPASSINSLQHTSSNETSPRLAHAIVPPPPPPPALSLLSSMRKTLLTSSGNSSGTDHGDALDEDEDAFPSLQRIHPRPDSEGNLTATGSRAAAAAAAAAAQGPQMLTTSSTSILPRAATDHHLPFLGAQPSFSALPPVPPLPFDLAPSYNGTLGLHASYSQLRSSYPSDTETSSWARASGSTGGQGKAAMAGDVDATTTVATMEPTTAKGGNRSLRFSAPEAPSSSPGWEVSFAPPPRGSERRPVSRSSTIEEATVTSSLRLEQDVLRRFSAAVDEGEGGDGDGDGMGVCLYPPLSQETALDSGQSQETGEASVDDEDGGGDARGQADADSAAEETQEEESQPS